jgi:hypothetical protein
MYNANRCGGMCPRTFCINREKVAGLPFKPYGILVHSQNPVGDRNAIFGRSSFRPFVVTSKSFLKTIFISPVLELKYFTGTNNFEHAEFKSEKFPLYRPAVFSQTAILSSLISQQLFSLFNETDR